MLTLVVDIFFYLSIIKPYTGDKQMSKFTFNDANLETMSLSFDYGGQDYTVIVDVVGDVIIRKDSNGLQYGDYLSLNEDELTFQIGVYDQDETPIEFMSVLNDSDELELNNEIISKLFELKYKEIINEEY